MIQVAPTLKMLSHALHSPRMIPMLCQRQVAKYLFST
uniref:Topless-related protein 4-like isoform X1 n=1 Tax=Rhizophora mucronata TaxID=61149 RepID=A0A2P2PGC7_RHIMU